MDGAPTLEQAIRAIASRDADHASQRNDIGFNGADTGFGNFLAARPEADWKPKWRLDAHAMLRKYAGQLAGLGIDYAAIPVPDGQAAAPARGGFAPARAPGRCAVCRQPISAGEMIGFKKTPDGRFDRFHERCATAAAPDSSGAPLTRSGPVTQGAPSPPSASASRRAPNRTNVEITGPRAADVLGPQGSVARALGARYEHRPQQLTLAEHIEQALAQSRQGDPVEGRATVHAHVVSEAGTGTGKSFAYIVPAALGRKKTIVSTAVKALQDQLLLKDLPFANEHVEGGVTFATLKGRTNYVCLLGHQNAKSELGGGGAMFASAEGPQQFAALDRWIESGEAEKVNGDLDQAPTLVNPDVRELLTVDSDGCLGKKCPLFSRCYVERAKAQAQAATIVVVNHALLCIDAKVKENSEGHAALLPRSDALVIDEAHRLEEYATNMLGEELTPTRWLRLERMLDRLTRKHKGAGEGADEWMMQASEVGVPWMAWFEALKARMEDENSAQITLADERAAAEPVLKALTALVRRMERTGPPSWLDEAEGERWGKLSAQMEKLAEWVGIAATPEEGDEDKFVRYAQGENARFERGRLSMREGRVVINVKPIDVSDYLNEAVWKAYPTVAAVSATLAVAGDFAPWRVRVGCRPADFPDVREYVCESPFPYRKNSILYVPASDALPSPSAKSPAEQERYFDALARMQQDLVLSGSARVFLLYTSNKALRACLQRLSETLPAEWQVFVQGELPRPQIVEAFKAEGGKKVLFATRTFFEGIDLQGEALTMVVIDKLPFPSHEDPVIKAKSKLVEKRGGNSFSVIMLPEVCNTLKQGAGRLIRTSTDYGVVAILDPRLRTARYGQTIIRSLPPMRPTDDLRAVRALYAEKGA